MTSFVATLASLWAAALAFRFTKTHRHPGNVLRASPTRVVSLATQKVQLTTLATAFSLHIPTDLLFYSLFYLKYYFSFLFYYIFLSTLNQR
jgi:hypothetical protein